MMPPLVLHPRFIDHPSYQNVKQMRMFVLGDFLETAAITWAARYNTTLPILNPDKQEDMKAEIQMFTDWLFGEVDKLRVIPGGKG